MADIRKHRTVALNPDAVLKHLRQRGWSVEDLTHRTGLSPGTISSAIKGTRPGYWKTADAIRKAFELESLDSLIQVDESHDSGDATRRINEWLLDHAESKWITASNQLQFRIWRLKHEHLAKFGRGKCYDLEGMATEERSRCRTQLLRHAEVCTKIGRHPNIISNVTTCEAPQKNGWWVIDEWIEGVTLCERLRQGPVEQAQALEYALQIAAGLKSLNDGNIVRRELAPQSILLEADTDRLVLTEFELAKLLDGSPTVSKADWPVDPYRAPEAGSNDVDQRADVYSWGRITIQMLCGVLPPEGDEAALMKSAKLPKKIESLLTKCVAVSRRSRPNGFDEFMDILSTWKVSQ